VPALIHAFPDARELSDHLRDRGFAIVHNHVPTNGGPCSRPRLRTASRENHAVLPPIVSPSALFFPVFRHEAPAHVRWPGIVVDEAV